MIVTGAKLFVNQKINTTDIKSDIPQISQKKVVQIRSDALILLVKFHIIFGENLEFIHFCDHVFPINLCDAI